MAGMVPCNNLAALPGGVFADGIVVCREWGEIPPCGRDDRLVTRLEWQA